MAAKDHEIISTYVPLELGIEIRLRAQAEDRSVASWLRRLLSRELSKPATNGERAEES